KTEYSIEIDNVSDNEALTSEELTKLMAATRIPEIIYRYSRYQYEATIEYLKQCDAKYGMSIMSDKDMLSAIETLGSELPKEDTSSFSFDKRTKDAKENASNATGLLLDDLFNRHDELLDKGLTDKTDEGQELRGMIRTFIEQEKLSVRFTRTSTNKDLLDQIEAELGVDQQAQAEQAPTPEPEPEPEKEPASESTERRRRR
ncbi:MAG: hypothetical protein RR559_06855, partial [Bacteroides sp.]